MVSEYHGYAAHGICNAYGGNGTVFAHSSVIGRYFGPVSVCVRNHRRAGHLDRHSKSDQAFQQVLRPGGGGIPPLFKKSRKS